MTTPTKENLSSYLQLTYFNKVLLKQGLITEKDFYRMAEQIRKRHPVD